ncbi:hypothetical protein ACIHEI_13595, partial [Kitasatospora sp. NPDC051984]
DLLAQGIELAEGHRRNIDLKELGQNALAGAIGGASGHLVGKGLGGAAGRLGLGSAARSLPGKAAIGAATGVGADAATQYLTTGKVDTSSLLGSGLSGGAGAGLHAGAASAKHHSAPPEPGGGPHSGPADLTRAGGDGNQDRPPKFGKPSTLSGSGSYQGPTGSTSTTDPARMSTLTVEHSITCKYYKSPMPPFPPSITPPNTSHGPITEWKNRPDPAERYRRWLESRGQGSSGDPSGPTSSPPHPNGDTT